MLRRGFLAGLGIALAAPTIIRTPGLIMPVKPIDRAPTYTLPDHYPVGSLIHVLEKEHIRFCTYMRTENGWRRIFEVT